MIYGGRSFIWKQGVSGYLYSLNPDTGVFNWSLRITGLRTSPLLAPDGTIYVGAGYKGGEGATLYAVNPNGTVKWKFVPTPSRGTFREPAISPNGLIIASIVFSPALDNPPNPRIYAIDPNDGTVEWQIELSEWGDVSPPVIDSDGSIYIQGSSPGGVLYKIGPDGSLKWKVELGGTIYQWPPRMPAIDSEHRIYTSGAFNKHGWNIADYTQKN